VIKGKLFYIIGSSGSGKDSVIRYAQARVSGDPGTMFAHRYITRPVELEGENHIALTEAEFNARRRAGLFAMNWTSLGLHYGIGCEIDLWLAKGCNVVVNGSREYLPEAKVIYPALSAVLICVAPENIEKRLRARGRETDEQIELRLSRAQQFGHIENVTEVIENNGTLASAGERFVALLNNASKG